MDRKPRPKLFVPTAETIPIPLHWLDINRRTRTDLDDEKEANIEDYWYNTPVADRDFFAVWTGKTTLDLLRAKPKPGYEWQAHRETQIRKNTQRPSDVRTDEWLKMNKSQQQKGYNSSSQRARESSKQLAHRCKNDKQNLF